MNIRNNEGYMDPTAYKAIKAIEKKRQTSLLTIILLCIFAHPMLGTFLRTLGTPSAIVVLLWRKGFFR